MTAICCLETDALLLETDALAELDIRNKLCNESLLGALALRRRVASSTYCSSNILCMIFGY